MNNLLLRRRALMPSGVNHDGYVSDGLILRLDGIKNTRAGHNASFVGWQDLSGNKNDCTFVDGGGLVWNGKGLDFFRDGGYVLTPLKYTDYCLNHTVEVVIGLNANNEATGCVFNDDTTVGNFYDGINGGGSGCMLAGVIDYIGWTGFAYPNTVARTVGTVSETTTWQYFSANIRRGIKSTTSLVSYTSEGYMSIGKMHAGNESYNGLKGKVLAVRIYNRALSNAELSANYSIDQQRFFT